MKKLAKNATIAMMTAAFIVGCVGAFIPTFQMQHYTMFLQHFSPIYISLILSIGTNSAIEKITTKK